MQNARCASTIKLSEVLQPKGIHETHTLVKAKQYFTEFFEKVTFILR